MPVLGKCVADAMKGSIHVDAPRGFTTVYPRKERACILVACPPELPSYAIQTSPPTCCSRTKTCPRLAATIPGAGGVRGNRSQFAARFNSGTMRPNKRRAAAQPQNEEGQPAGRPPTIRVLVGISSAAIFVLVTAESCLDRCIRNECRNSCPRFEICERYEKSHGMVTLHSEACSMRYGRASELREVITTKQHAEITCLNIAGSGIEGSCPQQRTANNRLAEMGQKSGLMLDQRPAILLG